MARKPSNWYSMTHQERQVWEKQAREIDDAEYEAEQAKQRAERADADLRRQRNEAKAARERYAEEMNATDEESSELREELATIREQRDKLLTVCKSLLELWPLAGYELEAFCGATLVPDMRAAVVEIDGRS